jgi:DNA invertase Pin-like site-specific DNA recombinase
MYNSPVKKCKRREVISHGRARVLQLNAIGLSYQKTARELGLHHKTVLRIVANGHSERTAKNRPSCPAFIRS